MRHFLEVDDLSAEEVERVLDLAAVPDVPKVLAGKGMALIFQKPSARTRNSTSRPLSIASTTAPSIAVTSTSLVPMLAATTDDVRGDQAESARTPARPTHSSPVHHCEATASGRSE